MLFLLGYLAPLHFDFQHADHANVLDAPLSHSRFFGTSDEAVVEKFREVKMQYVAFQNVNFLPSQVFL